MPSIPVFRITVLGSPEVGKTALCTFFTSHRLVNIYEHSTAANFFLREVRSAQICRLTSAENTSERSSKRQSGKRQRPKSRGRPSRGAGGTGGSSSGARLARYGVQLVDVPGEVYGQISHKDTLEYQILENDDPFPVARMEQGRKAHHAMGSSSHRQNSNRLHEECASHGYIVLFDISDEATIRKAISILKFLQGKVNQKLPILLFGNKLDTLRGGDDSVLSRWRNEFGKVGLSTDVTFGSIFHNDARDAENSALTIDEMLHQYVMQLYDFGSFDNRPSVADKRGKMHEERSAAGKSRRTPMDRSDMSSFCGGCAVQ